MISKLKKLKRDIIRLDKEKGIIRSKKVQKKLREAYIKKEFRDKYGIDITKELYDEELNVATDIKYHGKHRGKYNMITYIDTSDNILIGVNNLLDITIPDSCIGYKKDEGLMVEELKDVIDWFIRIIKEHNNGKHWNTMLQQTIRV